MLPMIYLWRVGMYVSFGLSAADGASKLMFYLRIGRTDMASSALCTGKFWIEDFNLGMRTR